RVPTQETPGLPYQSDRNPGSESGGVQVYTMVTDQESGEEEAYCIHVEIVQRATGDDPPHCWNAQHQQVRRAGPPRVPYLQAFREPALRFPDQETESGKDQSGSSRHKKRRLPAVMMGYRPADDVAQGDSNREPQHTYAAR